MIRLKQDISEMMGCSDRKKAVKRVVLITNT